MVSVKKDRFELFKEYVEKQKCIRTVDVSIEKFEEEERKRERKRLRKERLKQIKPTIEYLIELAQRYPHINICEEELWLKPQLQKTNYITQVHNGKKITISFEDVVE